MQEILATQLENDIWNSSAEPEYNGLYNGYRVYKLGGMFKDDGEIFITLWRMPTGIDSYEYYHVATEESLDRAIDMVVSHSVQRQVERNDEHNRLRYGVTEERFVRVSNE
jgi:hypothetical protein|tara:strand:+ start:54 stop:383 length:330 start_codon:yes stop_codon:yes gene_type:complete